MVERISLPRSKRVFGAFSTLLGAATLSIIVGIYLFHHAHDFVSVGGACVVFTPQAELLSGDETDSVMLADDDSEFYDFDASQDESFLKTMISPEKSVDGIKADGVAPSPTRALLCELGKACTFVTSVRVRSQLAPIGGAQAKTSVQVSRGLSVFDN